MIHLHTLGDTLITVGEKEVRPSTPMVFAALLYLGVERGRRVPRAALRELFFPESDERSGSHSVRQLLYKLRQLGVPIDVNASSICLAQALVHDSCADLTSNWNDDVAVRAVHGFVPSYEPRLSDSFRDWVELERQKVASRVRAVLAERLSSFRATANWQSVSRFAQMLLSADPLNEEATLALAEAAAATGSKQHALTLLAAYEKDTGTQLHLASDLVKRRISKLTSQGSVDLHIDPFLGRSDQLAGMLGRLRRSSKGAAIVEVVLGEPGIGKSRLLGEACRALTLDGVTPFIAKCRPYHDCRPLGVFTELVPQLLEAPGALGVSPESLGNLRKLVREDRSPDAPSTSYDDTARSEAFRHAITDLVSAVAGERRILIAVDDVQWCDSTSLGELRALAWLLPNLRLILTTRSLEGLRRHLSGLATITRLPPLLVEDMRAIAESLLGGGKNTSSVEWCVSIAGGNPLFLRMLCAHIAHTKSCSVPQDLTAVIESRLRLLDTSRLRVLQYAGLLGSHATLEALNELSALASTAFVECMSELEEQGYFARSSGPIRLAHDLVNDVALTILTPVTRRTLHAHVGRYLEQRFDNTGKIATLWDCAEQWRLSGETAKSVALLRRCAAHASALGQSNKALTILARAKELSSDSHHTVPLLTDMILAARAAGQLNDVLSLHRQLSLLNPESHNGIELLGIEAGWLLNNELAPQRLLKCLQTSSNTPEHRLEACSLLQRYAHEVCDAQLAHTSYHAVADLLPNAEIKDRLILQLIYHATFGDVQQAARFIDDLLDAIPSLENISDRLTAARNATIGLLIIGRAAEGVQVAKRYAAVASELGLTSRDFELKALIAACYLTSGDLDSGRKCVQELEAPPDSRWAHLTRTLHVEIALADQDEATASRLISELRDGGYGLMARNRSFLAGAELRLRQLDPTFVCKDEEYDQYMDLHMRTRSFISDDDFAYALAEDRSRRGMVAEALAILDDYVTSSRRQCWRLPTSFDSLRTRLRQANSGRSELVTH